MKKLILLLFTISFLKINAQEVEATTTAGTKIMINLNNYTWRYANTADAQKPCYTYHTADVKFINKTTRDVYIYYSIIAYKGNIKSTKIQHGDSVIVESLETKGNYYGSGNEVQYKYGWVASYEYYSNLNIDYNFDQLKEIKGFNSNEFTLEDCVPKVINIKD
jgi:hypothetical protein